MCHFRAQNSPFVLNKIFWYKPLLLPRACTLTKASRRGREGKNFTKVFAWEVGVGLVRNFSFGVGSYIAGGRGNFVGGGAVM